MPSRNARPTYTKPKRCAAVAVAAEVLPKLTRLPVAVVQAVKAADVKAVGRVMQAAQERLKTQCKAGKRKSKPKNLHTVKCSAKRSRTKNGI